MSSPAHAIRSRWAAFVRLSWREKWLIFEATFCLIGALLLVKLVPFRRWSRFLGAAPTEEWEEADPARSDIAREVGRAVRRANRACRGRFTCLMQAVAGKAMLNRRGVPNTLVLGVRTRRDNGGALSMEAHAWLRSGSAIILGGEAHRGFSIVAEFQSRHRSPNPPGSDTNESGGE